MWSEAFLKMIDMSAESKPRSRSGIGSTDLPVSVSTTRDALTTARNVDGGQALLGGQRQKIVAPALIAMERLRTKCDGGTRAATVPAPPRSLRGRLPNKDSSATAAMKSMYDEIIGTSNDKGSAVGVYDEFSDVIPSQGSGMTMSDVQGLDSERESSLEEQNGEFTVALPQSREERR